MKNEKYIPPINIYIPSNPKLVKFLNEEGEVVKEKYMNRRERRQLKIGVRRKRGRYGVA